MKGEGRGKGQQQRRAKEARTRARKVKRANTATTKRRAKVRDATFNVLCRPMQDLLDVGHKSKDCCQVEHGRRQGRTTNLDRSSKQHNHPAELPQDTIAELVEQHTVVVDTNVRWTDSSSCTALCDRHGAR